MILTMYLRTSHSFFWQSAGILFSRQSFLHKEINALPFVVAMGYKFRYIMLIGLVSKFLAQCGSLLVPFSLSCFGYTRDANSYNKLTILQGNGLEWKY